MKPRSKKMQDLYKRRRVLVAELLEEYPICMRCGSHRSEDIHEIVSRARGGSILDPENLVALCRSCHSFITQNPATAHAEGWSKHSWERDVKP